MICFTDYFWWQVSAGLSNESVMGCMSPPYANGLAPGYRHGVNAQRSHHASSRELIGKLREAQYALEKSDHLKNSGQMKKYRSIFENSMDAIFLLDDELRLVTVNKATTRMLEYREEELKGMYVTDLIEEFEEVERLNKEFNTLREVRDMEVKLVCKGGDVKTCLLSIVTSSGHGEKEFIQGILHDITQLRIAERSLLQMEKTALISKLVQTLAHEIRNPLNNVSLASQQLRKEDHYEFQNQYFDMIIRNNNRINAILTQLMFSSGEQLGKHEPTTVQSIVNDAVDGARDRLTLLEIELELNYPDREIPVVADKSQLSIALLNIITNAIEAMENEKGKLAIEVEVLGDYCEIRITDNARA
jgi:PAS domain S-box-containing protein